jgi:hypothetical protein
MRFARGRFSASSELETNRDRAASRADKAI